MHLLAFMLWRAPEYLRPAPAQQRRMEITWVLPPRPAPRLDARNAPPSGPHTAAQPRSARAPAAPQPIHLPPAAPSAVPPTAPSAAEAPQLAQPLPITPPDPFALPLKDQGRGKDKGDVLQQSLKSAGAVDRQLRKESWNPRDKHIVSAAVEEAEKGTRAGVNIETFELPDGRKMAKVRMPNGSSYCAATQSNALTGGRDPFRDGVKTQVSTCPR
ncbi:hypothetical protein ACLB1G_20155 [Oxalobacteraceae bacterium A2-2]